MNAELKKRIKMALPIITKPDGFGIKEFFDELKYMKSQLKCGSFYLCHSVKHEVVKRSITKSIDHYSTLDEFLDVVLDTYVNEDDIKTHVKMRMWWIKKNIKFYKNLM